MLEANGMKVLKKVVGKTKIDRIRSQQIRESCSIQPIIEWVEKKKKKKEEKKKRLGPTCNKDGSWEIS